METQALFAKIGADVPFFIHNCRFALANERGDRIKPRDDLKDLRLWHVIAVPTINVSTSFIYEEWDKLPSFRLTKPVNNARILISKLTKKPSSLGEGGLFNSLEQASERLYPKIRSVKQAFIKLGAKAVLMSGSGPSVFSIMPSYKEAVRVADCLRKNKSLQVFVSRTQ